MPEMVEDLPPQSLLTVFAHPDDESLASGGLIACCAAAGIRTTLLCLSRGGLGLVDDPARLRMGEERGRELAAAAGVLGASEVILLDYRNGFLPWEDRDGIDADLTAAITRLRPTVVVTFDTDGLYWHPDHLVVNERVNNVFASLGADAPALYYASMPRGAMRRAWEAANSPVRLEDDAPPCVLGVEVDAFGLFAPTPTLTFHAGVHAATKLRALRCHRSQVAGGALDRLPDAAAEAAFGVELYRRSALGAQGETFMERMGQLVATTTAGGLA